MPLFFYFAKFTKHIMRNRPTGVLEKSRRTGSIPVLFLFYFINLERRQRMCPVKNLN